MTKRYEKTNTSIAALAHVPKVQLSELRSRSGHGSSWMMLRRQFNMIEWANECLGATKHLRNQSNEVNRTKSLSVHDQDR